jgi:hypothetical protein
MRTYGRPLMIARRDAVADVVAVSVPRFVVARLVSDAKV